MSFNAAFRSPAIVNRGETVPRLSLEDGSRYSDMRQPIPPVHFDLDLRSPAEGGMTYIIRSQLRPDVLVPSLRRALQQIDPDLLLNHTTRLVGKSNFRIGYRCPGMDSSFAIMDIFSARVWLSH